MKLVLAFMEKQMFDSGINRLPIQVVNQTDRIQGMARYMNDAGSSTEVMSLLVVLAGMIIVVLLLRAVHRRGQKKRAMALAARKAKRDQTASKDTRLRGGRRRK